MPMLYSKCLCFVHVLCLRFSLSSFLSPSCAYTNACDNQFVFEIQWEFNKHENAIQLNKYRPKCKDQVPLNNFKLEHSKIGVHETWNVFTYKTKLIMCAENLLSISSAGENQFWEYYSNILSPHSIQYYSIDVQHQ